ncbi:cytochrome o ubiquinol oxidase subunit III [Buchnera aphidicola]|uniref:cytochrome o ubiquinol oxidase subunit III n=1 Tax=Buchnera aphidicola TaxID=9 RepID=UPI003464DE46
MIRNKKINNCLNSTEKHHLDVRNNKLLGFWIYLMSDCIIFAILFAVYAIYSSSVSKYLIHLNFFKLSFILLETFILLISSLSCGIMGIAVSKKEIKKFFLYLFLTFVLGLLFVCMESYEFYELVMKNLGPSRHAFFSAFFTLVGIHGLHVFFGLMWILTIFYQVKKIGFTDCVCTRITCFSFFWHFLDIIWVCVFTFVYLNGVI